MARLWLITGTTRGLGAALAQAAVAAGDRVIGLSRHPGAAGDTVIVDLADPQAAVVAFAKALPQAVGADIDDVLLVHNAAVLGPVGSGFSMDDAAQHYAINLLSPIALSQAFIAALAQRPIRKRIVAMSSGAAVKAFAGWSLYGSSKAALEQFGRCLAAEQVSAAHPVEVVAISPGVIDTGMQAQIRASDAGDFPDVARFHELQASGVLQAPAAVAQLILAGVPADRVWAGETVSTQEWAASVHRQ